MKNLITILFIMFAGIVSAQVGINTEEPKAALDIENEFLGIQFPRLTTEQINQIENPEEGLMVFNTDINCIVVNIDANQPKWKRLTLIDPF